MDGWGLSGVEGVGVGVDARRMLPEESRSLQVRDAEGEVCLLAV